MNINHQAWWTMIRYMNIQVINSWLHIQYISPKPRVTNFGVWIGQHIWYIFEAPPIHLRYHQYTQAIPLANPRFVLLFAGNEAKGLTNILYSVVWTLVIISSISTIDPCTHTTATILQFFSMLTDEIQNRPTVLLHSTVDPVDN
jgi:hypothetical protein